MEWVLGGLSEQVSRFSNVRFSRECPSIRCTLHFGSLAEIPFRTLQPGSWTPAPDAAVVVRSDCVEIRRIHLFFSLWQGADPQSDEELWFQRELDLDTLHRVLSERLRFA